MYVYVCTYVGNDKSPIDHIRHKHIMYWFQLVAMDILGLHQTAKVRIIWKIIS